jgi:hypothetical protein
LNSPSISITRQLAGHCANEPHASALSEARHLHRLIVLGRETPDSIRALIGSSNPYRRRVRMIFEYLLDPQKARTITPVVKEPVEVCEPPARVRPPEDLYRLSPAEIEEATQMLRDGKTWREVHVHLGCSRKILFTFVKFRKGKLKKAKQKVRAA